MGTLLPAWIGPTVAISLVVIAGSFAIIALAAALVLRKAATEISELSDELGKLRQELSPALVAMRRVADAGAEISGSVRAEVEQYLITSKALRLDLERGVRRVKHRLADLDALYEVVHEEVEDTALDVVAKVRSVRAGAGMVGRIRRWLVRGRR
jgi:hypothetical protein